MIRFFAVFAFVAGLSSIATAQLSVRLAAERSAYLLYEPLVVTVELTNTSNEPILLHSGPQDRPWMSFLVRSVDGRKIRSEDPLALDPVNLGPGQRKLLSINLTPLYAIRETGQYTVQASVQPPGKQGYLTDALSINIGKGDTVWTRTYVDGGIKRVVSLIRFVDRREVALYLRVEEPQENLVYSTTRLGRVVAFTEPQVELDAQKGIYIIHPIGSRTYRYTRASAEGVVIAQEDRESGTTPPTLVRRPGGTIELVGGIENKKATERPKLSAAQQGI